MSRDRQLEDLIAEVVGLEREELLRRFAATPAPFPIDFTPDYLQRQSTDRLRHLLVAVCLQTNRHAATAA